MAQSEFETFGALFQRILQCHAQSDYVAARDLIAQQRACFPQNAAFLDYADACMLARMGRAEAALDALRTLIRGGFWLGEHYWLDEDFNSLREYPAFDALRRESDALMQQAQAAARDELLTILPSEQAQAAPVPLLVALHGNYSSVRWHRAHWEPAARHGWLVALPQSREVAALDTESAVSYSWDDESRAVRAIQGHFAALTRAYQVDMSRVVVGGFSRGAEMAVRQVVTGAIPARGFIAVCPGGPLTRDPALWEPLVAQARGRDLRGIVIEGERDQFGAGTQRLVALLREAGVTVKAERVPELGHDYPPQFSAQIMAHLQTVLG